ncbi:MAG: hypothetical protein QM630_06830 [Microbacterium sp.]
MSEPSLVPRNAFVGVFVVWGIALVASIAVGIFVPEQWRVSWLLLVFGALVLVSFGVQLWYGNTQGFIFRVACSALGALLLTGLIAVGFGLAALAPA